jgi:hypothetical protein
MWMYEDGSCCGWGHRHAILWYPYDDNSGPAGREGFLGIGRAHGGPYQGPFSQPWAFAEIIVMNVFDPCASWSYSYPPGAATLSSPSGAITDTTPTYTWNVSPDTDTQDPATWYYLWVNGPAGNVIQQWYQASAICNTTSCSVTSGSAPAGGAHTWWVQTWNSAGYGPWSGGMIFSLPTIPTPGAAGLVSPSGAITDTTPDYTWNKVNDATWYYVWVNGPAGNVIKQWYEASVVCGASTCSATPATTLSGGAHTWWIQTWNTGGYGPWSAGMNFSIPLPGAATLVSPSGAISATTPTYTWNKVPDVTWYYLWVNGPSGNAIKQWYEVSAICGASTCSVTPATALIAGAHTWWIQTWNNAGYGAWSSAKNFTVSP